MADTSEARDVLLNQLADEFAARFRAGERPSLREYCERHPALARDIRELFPAMAELEQAKDARTVDLTVTSLRKQLVTLIARYGIEVITAPAEVLATALVAGSATCDLQLPEGSPVEIHLKLGRRNPLEWVNWVA